jgi:hypothetical protein
MMQPKRSAEAVELLVTSSAMPLLHASAKRGYLPNTPFWHAGLDLILNQQEKHMWQ